MVLYTFAVCCALLASARAADDLWTTDYDGALQRAKTEDKMVFLEFTGSDWCGGCIFLRENVFSTETFKAFARKHLILVQLDFPLKKDIESDLKRRNEELRQKYGVMNFPALILLNASGRKAGEIQFKSQSAPEFVESLKKIAATRSVPGR